MARGYRTKAENRAHHCQRDKRERIRESSHHIDANPPAWEMNKELISEEQALRETERDGARCQYCSFRSGPLGKITLTSITSQLHVKSGFSVYSSRSMHK